MRPVREWVAARGLPLIVANEAYHGLIVAPLEHAGPAALQAAVSQLQGVPV